MYETMSMEVLEQRREELLHEAELGRLKRALRTDRKKPAVARWASSVAWKLARTVGLLRKFLRTAESAH